MRRTLPLALLALLALPACKTVEHTASTVGGVIVDGADAVANFATDAYSATIGELGPAKVPDNALVAVADIRAPGDTATAVSGEIAFVQTTDGVAVRYDIRGLTPGEHGFHVHEGTSCGAANGEAGGAAGGHFSPMSHPHGARTNGMDSRHAGDLGNITANANGRAQGQFADEVAALNGTRSIAGHAIIVHGRRDDLTSQPSGDADGRVGCGVIEIRGTTRN